MTCHLPPSGLWSLTILTGLGPHFWLLPEWLSLGWAGDHCCCTFGVGGWLERLLWLWSGISSCLGRRAAQLCPVLG
jgi:hypothetical protein